MWEPCAGDMRVVHMMKERGHVVLHGDIQTGKDFFDYKQALTPNLNYQSPLQAHQTVHRPRL